MDLCNIFEDDLGKTNYQTRMQNIVSRYIAIRKVGDGLFVVFTERKETIRLISARLATNAEKELYYDQNINY